MTNSKDDQSPEARAQRLRVALELANAGIALRRQQFRRAHPLESESEIDDRLQRWLLDRPLDAPGRRVDSQTLFES